MMRLRYPICLCVLVSLTGCGGSKPPATISITCGGNIALAGAVTVDVLGDPVNGRPTLSFPDPANAGQTNTLAVPAHQSCTITPTIAPTS